VQRQAEKWDPMLEWAEASFGARLEPRTGVIHAAQDAQAIEKLTAEVHALTPFQLAAFHDLVSLSGSLVLGLAAAKGQASVDEIWALSRLDETWQEEQWGEDEEATELAERKRGEFNFAEKFYRLATQS
jgi:chaperone required for assembly of F1-ATPase